MLLPILDAPFSGLAELPLLVILAPGVLILVVVLVVGVQNRCLRFLAWTFKASYSSCVTKGMRGAFLVGGQTQFADNLNSLVRIAAWKSIVQPGMGDGASCRNFWTNACLAGNCNTSLEGRDVAFAGL